MSKKKRTPSSSAQPARGESSLRQTPVHHVRSTKGVRKPTPLWKTQRGLTIMVAVAFWTVLIAVLLWAVYLAPRASQPASPTPTPSHRVVPTPNYAACVGLSGEHFVRCQFEAELEAYKSYPFSWIALAADELQQAYRHKEGLSTICQDADLYIKFQILPDPAIVMKIQVLGIRKANLPRVRIDVNFVVSSADWAEKDRVDRIKTYWHEYWHLFILCDRAAAVDKEGIGDDELKARYNVIHNMEVGQEEALIRFIELTWAEQYDIIDMAGEEAPLWSFQSRSLHDMYRAIWSQDPFVGIAQLPSSSELKTQKYAVKVPLQGSLPTIEYMYKDMKQWEAWETLINTWFTDKKDFTSTPH